MRITRALLLPVFSAAMLAAPQNSHAGCCGLFDWLFHRNDACCPPQTYAAGYAPACCPTTPTTTFRPVFRRFALFRPWTTSSVACCPPQTVYRPIFGSTWSAASPCCPTTTCGTACGGCNSCGTSGFATTSFAPSTFATTGGGCSSCTSGYAPSTIISGDTTISGGSTLQPTPLDGAPRTFRDEGAHGGDGAESYPQSNPGTGALDGSSDGANAPIRIQDPNNRVTSAPKSWTFRQTVARPYEVKPRLIPVQSKTESNSVDDEGWAESDR